MCELGSAASKFAGQAVHKRLTTEVAYREGRWADAMKDAFLGADADLKAGM
jgi:protein phosphatase 2C family protein 2/3